MEASHLFRFIAGVVLIATCSTHAMPKIKQSLRSYPFRSASVLPITYLLQDGKPVKYAILAQETNARKQDEYDDFGGRKDENDGHPVNTAAREFYEEAIVAATLGWSLSQTEEYIALKTGNTQLIFAHNKRVTYLTYFSPIQIALLKHKFHAARAAQLNPAYKEKKQIATVRWDILASAIRNATSNKGVQVPAYVVDPATGNDEQNPVAIRLRSRLVKILRPFVLDEPYREGKKPEIRFY